MFEVCNDDRMSTWKIKAMPSLPTKDLIVQFSCQDVIFQGHGARSVSIICYSIAKQYVWGRANE